MAPTLTGPLQNPESKDSGLAKWRIWATIPVFRREENDPQHFVSSAQVGFGGLRLGRRRINDDCVSILQGRA